MITISAIRIRAVTAVTIVDRRMVVEDRMRVAGRRAVGREAMEGPTDDRDIQMGDRAIQMDGLTILMGDQLILMGDLVYRWRVMMKVDVGMV